MKKIVLHVLCVVLLAAEGDTDKKTPKPRFRLAKETTYVTEPLDAEGYIDYAAALNERLRRDVTPENNANVLLWRAFGPHPEGSTMPPVFFKWMGIKPLPEQGDYFLPMVRFAREQLKLDPGPGIKAIESELSRCGEREWKAREHPNIAAWLEANEKPLSLVIEATKRTQYYSPLVPRPTKNGPTLILNALLSGAQACRGFAVALTARALLRVGEGRFDDACQDLLACHRLGRLVARGTTMIELLVGLAIDSTACKADLAFLERLDWKAEQIVARLHELQGLSRMPPVADKMDLSERFMFLEIIATVDRYGPEVLESLGDGPVKEPNPFLKLLRGNVDYEPALRIANRWFDRIGKTLRIEDRTTRERQMAQLDVELKALKKKPQESMPGGVDLGEAIGNILIVCMLPAFNKVQSAADRCEQTRNNLSLAFALAAYRRDHGCYPKELSALSPKYLNKIPTDLFSDKPLIYRPNDNSYLLYSVGVNGRDERGRSYEDRPRGDDLTIRMPLPKSNP